MSVVSVKKAESYDEALIFAAVREHFDILGVGDELRPDMKVLIKPNLLAGRKPEAAVTTHHALLSAVVRYLRERGVAKITIADSPAGPYTPMALKAEYSACGYRIPGLEEYLNYDVAYSPFPCPQGFRTRSFNIITPALEADYIINVAKLKTHAMTTMSCAVKNLFGLIPGLQKPDMHYRFPALEDFSEMLCELTAAVKPDIALLDAVDSMEGNGPGGGTVKHTGYILASRDPFALDAAAARFMGLDPETVPHLAAAKRRGFMSGEPEPAGDPLIPVQPPFKLPDAVTTIDFTSRLPKFLRPLFAAAAKRLVRAYPKVKAAACIGCGKCAESCPRHIIKLENKKAVIPREGCISCFCCQEMCPAHAIDAKRGLKM